MVHKSQSIAVSTEQVWFHLCKRSLVTVASLRNLSFAANWNPSTQPLAHLAEEHTLAQGLRIMEKKLTFLSFFFLGDSLKPEMCGSVTSRGLIFSEAAGT